MLLNASFTKREALSQKTQMQQIAETMAVSYLMEIVRFESSSTLRTTRFSGRSVKPVARLRPTKIYSVI